MYEVKYTVKEVVDVSEHNKMTVRVEAIVNDSDMSVKRKINNLIKKIEKALPDSNHMLILNKVVAKIAVVVYEHSKESNLHNKQTDVVVRIANTLIVKLDFEGVLTVRYRKLTSTIIDYNLVLDSLVEDAVTVLQYDTKNKLKWFIKKLNKRVY